MHMTNNRAYLKDKSSGDGLSKKELKLKADRRSSDSKKIVEVLNHLPKGGSGHHPDLTSRR